MAVALCRLLAYPGHSLQSTAGISTLPRREMNGRWNRKEYAVESSVAMPARSLLTQGVCEIGASAPGGVLLCRKSDRFLGVADSRFLVDKHGVISDWPH